MLLLPLVVVGFISKADDLRDLNFKDYVTSSQVDAKGRTLFHVAAEHCDEANRIDLWLQNSIAMLAFTEPNLKHSGKNPSLFVKDLQGRTAVDVAEEKFNETKSIDCGRLAQDYYVEMKKEYEKMQAAMQQ